MLSDVLLLVTKAAMLTFVVTGMVGVGLTLTIKQVVQPWRDVRMVVLLLVANFVVVPLTIFALVAVLPIEPDAGTAVVLLACVAGAPFLPRLAQQSHGDVAVAVGVMVLLMVVTVGYAPLVVPVLVEGATISAGDIASSLVLLMLLPLVIGLGVRARYPELAAAWAPHVTHASSTALLLGVGAAVLVSWRDILGALGSWIFVALAVLLAVGAACGALVGLRSPPARREVLALATAQRNVSAALVIATQLDGDVLVYTLVGAIALPVVLMLVSGELGRRRASTDQPVTGTG